MGARGTEKVFEPEELAKKLPRDIRPSKDLWPGIEARLDEVAGENGQPRQSPLLAAAAVILLVAASIIGIVSMNDPNGKISTAQTRAENEDASDVLSITAWSRYFDKRFDVSETFAIEALPVEVREDVVASINDVRSARKAIEDALMREPNNTWLRSLWMQSYEQEMDLLNDAAWAANSLEERVRT